MFGMGRDSFLLFSCMCCGHDSFLGMSLFLEDSCGKDISKLIMLSLGIGKF
jgi:hypothetical protein